MVSESLAAAGQVADMVMLGLVALLGVALFFVRPRSPSLLALAIFLVCYGVFINLYDAAYFWLEAIGPLNYAMVPLLAVATGALVVLARRFPRPLQAKGRRSLLVALVVASSYGLVRAGMDVQFTLEHGRSFASWDPPWLFALWQTTYDLGLATYYGVNMVLAVRCRELGEKGDESGGIAAALVGAAFGPIGIMIAMYDLLSGTRATNGEDMVYWLNGAFVVVPLVVFWVWAAAGPLPRLARAARNVALVFVGFALLCLGAFLFDLPIAPFIAAASRAVGFGVLTYAILRQQLFDIDIRLKWTLSRGTVAALFLAAFFVVAQLAQNFLTDSLGWAVGGIVAGLLLFALAPIQRAAERLSDRAMPKVRPKDPAYVLRRKRETYRNAYAAAWSDGTLTVKDARLLAEFKQVLGLPDKDYAAIERDWARSSQVA